MSTNLTIGEFASLSIVEILTLQKLVQHKGPVVRYILYQEVNQMVNPKLPYKLSAENLLANSLKSGSEAAKDLSTSSFYNSLRTLAKSDLVSFIKNKKDKIEAVEATEKAVEALRAIFSNFLLLLIDDYDYLIELATNVLERIGNSHFPAILSTNLYEDVDLNLLSYFFEIADQVFFLSEPSVYENMLKMGFDKLNATNMIGKIIREPDNIFDVAIIPGYEKEPNFYGLTRIELLLELKRVVKEQGVVITVVRSELPKTDNFYAKFLLDTFKMAIEGSIFTEQELQADLKEAGFEKTDVFEFRGLIIGIGWV